MCVMKLLLRSAVCLPRRCALHGWRPAYLRSGHQCVHVCVRACVRVLDVTIYAYHSSTLQSLYSCGRSHGHPSVRTLHGLHEGK
jgi:hypothetical protein